MSRFITLLIFVASFSIAQNTIAEDAHTVPNGQFSYLRQSRASLNRVLDHAVFANFDDYIVDTFREGEIGESQAFFVRLVKPFSGSNEGYCFVFIGTSKLKDNPRKCSAAE